MIACVDVDYRGEEAVAACVVFRDWPDTRAEACYVERVAPVAAYEPGQFYRRELPCLLAVLGRAREPIELVVVDGYVWLGGEERPGLGARLYEALGRQTPVVGVAKTHFHGACLAREVVRGDSRRPLYVTAVGIDADEAACHIQGMSGGYRVPDLLKQVDQLCRWAPRSLEPRRGGSD